MAYTLQEAAEVAGLTTAQKDFLKKSENANKRLGRETVFEVDSDAKLKKLLNERIAANEKQKESQKERTDAYNDCIAVVRRLTGHSYHLAEETTYKTVNGAIRPVYKAHKDKSVISAKELLEKLLALEDSIKNEKQFSKLSKAIESSGMTKEQIIEYVQSKM